MQLVGRRIEKDGSGYVTLVPQDDEDMWHIYNLIQEGDDVRAAAVRRVQSVTNTGSTSSERVHLHLTLRVTKVEFSSSSSSAAGADAAQPSNGPAIPTATLSISGRVSEENRHVKMGAFHTLDLEAHRNVKIIKEHWIVLLCSEWKKLSCRGEVRKSERLSVAKGLAKFYEALYAGFLRHIPVESLRVIVIASPGFTKDSVYDYIFQEATRTSNKTILQSRHKFVRIHVTSPHVHSLVDVLKSPEMLGSDEARAWYGPDHVALAADRGAIGTLLISDELFRSGDVNERKKYVALVESVREKRGEVLIFSSMHETGQPILNFPLDVEMVEAEEQAAKDEEEARAREEAEGVGQG
ncbi:hypothetical protein RHS01_01909 [Rhizoctonia solani]|uniref:eRF1/Pelota-like N-terminal domain-containing protein n=1 Tax=Rhizoctonia solani TaxID=456999 RepID=A0A8H7M4Z4_9AGAM|nr:hypothetical protein RHS01_01909 [Rhizoctonia solani]